ncbi:MAG: hypothetical protein D8M57_04890 [Candidatus Scalindua sp. AMX11]|nr:MAG: hypothetical protein DWQ00_03705 [Candidatus Scalindua sp.]TDE66151.1 MAG: hypothetical protein D8M57_04890 [Candidatus Scalindua sp. AMX11]
MQVECKDRRLGERVIGAIEDCFFMTRNGSISNSPDITLRFERENSLFKVPERAQVLCDSPSLRVLQDGDFCYLVRGNSIFKLNLACSRGNGSIDPHFWESPPKYQQEFLMLSLLWLFRNHGLYALHANGLVKDDFGILFLGGSGSGKSTAALSLIRQGWGYLSDDVNLIRHRSDGIEALAFQKGFSFDPHLSVLYPDLDNPMVPHSLNGHKRFLDINLLYPDGHLNSCFPRVLIFPKIVSQGKSHISQIEKSKGLIMLIENSGGIMLDKAIVAMQIEILKLLVSQTDCYQLFAGRDLYEEPEKITEVLSGIVPRPKE